MEIQSLLTMLTVCQSSLNQKCGYTTCDITQQYCDTKLMNRPQCLLCADICEPSRIGTNSLYYDDCYQKCPVYMERGQCNPSRFITVTTTQSATTTTSAAITAGTPMTTLGVSLATVIIVLLLIVISVLVILLIKEKKDKKELMINMKHPQDQNEPLIFDPEPPMGSERIEQYSLHQEQVPENGPIPIEAPTNASNYSVMTSNEEDDKANSDTSEMVIHSGTTNTDHDHVNQQTLPKLRMIENFDERTNCDTNHTCSYSLSSDITPTRQNLTEIYHPTSMTDGLPRDRSRHGIDLVIPKYAGSSFHKQIDPHQTTDKVSPDSGLPSTEDLDQNAGAVTDVKCVAT